MIRHLRMRRSTATGLFEVLPLVVLSYLQLGCDAAGSVGIGFNRSSMCCMPMVSKTSIAGMQLRQLGSAVLYGMVQRHWSGRDALLASITDFRVVVVAVAVLNAWGVREV